jgi:hypothetical protein
MSLLHPWCWNRADVKIRGANSSPEVAKAIITRELLERLYLHAQRLPVGAAWQCHSSGPWNLKSIHYFPRFPQIQDWSPMGLKFQTLRPSDPQTLVFLSLKNITVNQSVYVYIYIHPYLYIWYIWSKKKNIQNVDTMYCWVPVGVPRWAAPKSFEGPPVASPTASPVPWCSDGAFSAGGICWAKNHGENDNYPIFWHNSNMENHDKQLDFGV